MSKVKAVPEGLHTVTAALAVDGASDAIAFYKKAFGAEEVSRAPDPSGKKIWHAQIRIGDSQIFVNDVFPEMGGSPSHSNLWLYVADVDGSFKRAVGAGARSAHEPSDMFWGDRMAQVEDPFGQKWTLATRVKDLTPDEQKKAADAFVAQMKKAQP